MTEKAYDIDPVLIDVPMPIETPRLILRPPQAGEGAEIAAFVDESWDNLHRWTSWAADRKEATDPARSEAFSRIRAADFVARKDLMLRGVDRDTGLIAVMTGLHRMDWRIRSFEIGYCVRKRFEGKGYATESANALLRYAFGVLSARRVSIFHAVGNDASRRVIEKLGFEFECVRRFDLVHANGSLADCRYYSRYDTENLPPLDVRWGPP